MSVVHARGGLEEKGEDKGTEGKASCIFSLPLFFTALSYKFNLATQAKFVAEGSGTSSQHVTWRAIDLTS